jgi:poly(3-hydroxybutyrate) depolymerase
MRTGWFGRALKSLPLACFGAALFGALLSGCSADNVGNVTLPPPPSAYIPTSSTGGGGGPSVIPMGGSLKVLPSTGCGKPLPATQVPTIPASRTGYTEFHVTQTGKTLGTDVPADAGERQFFVRVPYDYDPNTKTPYRVVYIGQGCGAQHAGKTNTYPLFNETQGGSEQAVYVGLSVPDNAANPGCYDNNTGPQSQEWEAFELIHGLVESTYCVDNNRIYVSGYSTGGWLSNMWGCYFGGESVAADATPLAPLDQPDLAAGLPARKFAPKWSIRGHVNVTGSLPTNQPQPCNGKSAGLWIHDVLDKSNLIATNIAALNLSLQTNGCTGNYEAGPKQPWAPAENIAGLKGGICQEYTGCPADTAAKYPLVFCTTSGLGHGDQSTSAIPAFTTFFNLMDPAP